MTAPGIPAIVPKLIARLSSPFDYEVISTARSIGRILESNKLDWNDLATALTARSGLNSPARTPRAESAESAEIRAWLEAVSNEPWANDWTRSFITSVLSRQGLDRLSKKQIACVNNIIAEAYRRGVRPGREAA
jgi:hypothetical protein